jgi:AraC-like DNA-binding protein
VTATLTAPIRVSRAPLAPGRIVRGHEGFMKLNMELDFVNRSTSGRKFSVVAKSLGAVGFGYIEGTAATFMRKREHLADGRDLISINISGSGRFKVEGVHGIDHYERGGAVVLESRRESTLHSLDDTTAWTICLDRAPLEPLLADISDPIQRCLPGDNPGIRLLQGYLSSLFSLDQDCDLTMATTHVRDLALCALGVRGDVQALARGRGVQAARQSAVLNAIVKRASEPDLDPARVAEQLGMSPRYLHRLLEPTGRSFAQHLLQRRLDCAAAMLRDPASQHLKIAEIASLAGFADISHFNRSFRRAFGDTPFGLRVRAGRKASAFAEPRARAAAPQAAGQGRVGLA